MNSLIDTFDGFSVFNAKPKRPVLVHIPHSSSLIPQEYRDDFLVSDETLAEEQRKLVDWYTDQIAEPLLEAGCAAVRFDCSRFLLDPERYEQDEREPMAATGMGVLYERGCDGSILRAGIPPRRREELISRYYRPYHRMLEELARTIMQRFGSCTLVDVHSYPEVALPYEQKPKDLRPQVCLGTDNQHSPAAWLEQLRACVESHGYSVGYNLVFSGTYVPLALYGDKRLRSVMWEIRRDIYMDERTSLQIPEKTASLKRLVEALSSHL